MRKKKICTDQYSMKVYNGHGGKDPDILYISELDRNDRPFWPMGMSESP
jgi:hypothetical protein